MNALSRNMLALAGAAFVTQAVAQVAFYEQENFGGRSFTTQAPVEDFGRYGFNDRASSVVVTSRLWEVCDDARFNGRCVVLRPGRYPSLASMGLNDRVSSVQPVGKNARIEDHRYAPAPVAAQVTFYENEGFAGRTFTTEKQVVNLRRFGFNDRASSVTVSGDRWEVCDQDRFRGRCAVLRPGRYPSLASMGLNNRVSSVRVIAGNGRIAENRYAPAPIVAQITFYEREGFGGRSVTTVEARDNFTQFGFNDRASSMVVAAGASWEACEHAGYQGRCVLLRPGRYPTMASMGMDNQVSSVRIAGAPAPVAARDYRRRQNERTFEADVTSVKAVVGTPEQRCWVEPGQVEAQSKLNIPGALVGAVLGGILGHQVGGGIGKDVATAGGAVAGAAVGANVGRTPAQAGPDVKRCENVPGSAKADYWDVSYQFRGQEHRVQMAAPPAGPTITVNERGEPRA